MHTIRWILLGFLLVCNGGAIANEQNERNAIESSARATFLGRNFTDLERLSNWYTHKEKRTPSGVPKLVFFDRAIMDVLWGSGNEREIYFNQNDSLTAKWVAENPTSSLAYILHARSLLAHGFFFRGRGYANTVPPHAWADFIKWTQASSEYLLKHKKDAAGNAGWYSTLIDVGLMLSWKSDQIMSIADEGTARFPEDERIYRSIVEYLLPKWHGDVRQLDQFINAVTTKTQKDRGMEMYARLYANASGNQFMHRLFEDSKAEWPKMKRGLDDMVKSYPGPWNKNTFAYYSCMARDKQKTRELLKEISASPIMERWQPNPEPMFESCRRWAAQP